MSNKQAPAILGRYTPDDDGPPVAVTLLNFPLQVYAASRQHHDEVLREIALLSLSPSSHGPGQMVSTQLIELVNAMALRFQGVGDRWDAARDSAIARGQSAMDLHYRVPPSVGPALAEVARLLDLADDLCRNGELLTMPATRVVKEFRTWFIAQFTDQAEGTQPEPWSGSLDPDS